MPTDPNAALFAALDGSLAAGPVVVCTGCGMARNWDMVNLKTDPKPCIGCGEETTWRRAEAPMPTDRYHLGQQVLVRIPGEGYHHAVVCHVRYGEPHDVLLVAGHEIGLLDLWRQRGPNGPSDDWAPSDLWHPSRGLVGSVEVVPDPEAPMLLALTEEERFALLGALTREHDSTPYPAAETVCRVLGRLRALGAARG